MWQQVTEGAWLPHHRLQVTLALLGPPHHLHREQDELPGRRPQRPTEGQAFRCAQDSWWPARANSQQRGWPLGGFLNATCKAF